MLTAGWQLVAGTWQEEKLPDKKRLSPPNGEGVRGAWGGGAAWRARGTAADYQLSDAAGRRLCGGQRPGPGHKPRNGQHLRR